MVNIMVFSYRLFVCSVILIGLILINGLWDETVKFISVDKVKDEF